MTKLFFVLAAAVAFLPRTSQALIGGEASAQFPEVIKLQAGKKVCTGTIIGPRTILSAAHCVTSAQESPHFVHRGVVYKVSFLSSSERRAGHDLALAITTKDIKGARFAQMGKGLKHGSEITLAGFGCTQKGGTPGPLHVGRNRVIGMDSDHILSASKEGAVSCEGDSGGPSFVQDGDVRRLVAVSSLSDIEKININVRTDSEQSYAFFKAATETNGLEICGLNSGCR